MPNAHHGEAWAEKDVTALEVLQEVWRKPGQSANEIAEHVRGAAAFRTFARNKTRRALQVLCELDIVRSEVDPKWVQESRGKWVAGGARLTYWPGTKILAEAVDGSS